MTRPVLTLTLKPLASTGSSRTRAPPRPRARGPGATRAPPAPCTFPAETSPHARAWSPRCARQRTRPVTGDPTSGHRGAGSELRTPARPTDHKPPRASVEPALRAAEATVGPEPPQGPARRLNWRRRAGGREAPSQTPTTHHDDTPGTPHTPDGITVGYRSNPIP
jgi:hypothetical protein